ncbi:MAG: response regulator transcription factor [Flavobacteriaceae bacterium]|nr:response regulator transcription factor [Flavobacteriaceae bacterium]
MLRVLFLEDNEDLAFAVTETLSVLGDYDIIQANNGEKGMELYHELKPQIVISDVEMPKMNGFEVAQAIRAIDKECIILLATGLYSSKDIAKGFEIGVDEYVKKPYSPSELHIRIQAIIQRLQKTPTPQKEETEQDYSIGKYQFNFEEKCLFFQSEKIKLTPKEFSILEILYSNKNQLVTKEHITNELWGESDFFSARSFDVFISKLRKHLSKDPNVSIETVRGEGIILSDA